MKRSSSWSKPHWAMSALIAAAFAVAAALDLSGAGKHHDVFMGVVYVVGALAFATMALRLRRGRGT